MTKPALYYTLVRSWHVGGFRVMKVTTEKSRQLYGTVDDDMPTHVNPRQTVGRFATKEEAESRIVAADAVRAKYAPLLKRAREAEMKIETAQREAIEAVIRGVTWEPVLDARSRHTYDGSFLPT